MSYRAEILIPRVMCDWMAYTGLVTYCQQIETAHGEPGSLIDANVVTNELGWLEWSLHETAEGASRAQRALDDVLKFWQARYDDEHDVIEGL